MTAAVLKLVTNEKTKACSKCKVEKSYSEYHKNKDRKIGIQPRCKTCRNENYKDPRGGSMKARPDKLKRLYGLTYEQVLRTLDSQLGLCANRACGKEISLEVSGTMKNRAVIDHCHVTGKFRALLCPDCNLTLGKIENNKNKLFGLLEYMNKHNNLTKE